MNQITDMQHIKENICTGLHVCQWRQYITAVTVALRTVTMVRNFSICVYVNIRSFCICVYAIYSVCVYVIYKY